MRKKLVRHGNSLALIIDKPILELLGIGEEDEVEIRTDGRKLEILPEGYVDYTQEEFRRVLDKVFERHDATFRKLAE